MFAGPHFGILGGIVGVVDRVKEGADDLATSGRDRLTEWAEAHQDELAEAGAMAIDMALAAGEKIADAASQLPHKDRLADAAVDALGAAVDTGSQLERLAEIVRDTMALNLGQDRDHPLIIFIRQHGGTRHSSLADVLKGPDTVHAVHDFLVRLGPKDHAAIVQKIGERAYIEALEVALAQFGKTSDLKTRVGAARFLDGAWRDYPLPAAAAARLMLVALTAHDFTRPVSAPEAVAFNGGKDPGSIDPFLAQVRAGALAEGACFDEVRVYVERHFPVTKG